MIPECNCGHTFICEGCFDPGDADTGPSFDDLEPIPPLRIDVAGERNIRSREMEASR